jgi:hypothetical protein
MLFPRLPNLPNQSTIANNKVAIFSKSWCPYCASTKTLFATKFPEIQAEIVECVVLSRTTSYARLMLFYVVAGLMKEMMGRKFSNTF